MGNKVLTVCPYCGSGCQLYLLVENGQVVGAEPADGRTNEGNLCLKGHYGWDFLNDPQLLTSRLRKPMIRKEGVLQEVTWEEAIQFTAEKLTAIKEKYGPDAIMGTGSARGPGNEANYVMQKFMRAAIGTNNIDHCARVCHGPSVAGLTYSLGDGAMSNSIPEIEDTDLLLIFGYNAAVTHPIVARRIVKAKQKGATLIVADPRMTESARIADTWLPLKGGSNMALVNAFGHVLVEEELYDKDYVSDFVEGFEEYKANVQKYTPEYAESITGVRAADIRKSMRQYAKSDKAMILYGMGVCQFAQAVDVVKGLASLALLTGHFGRASVGIGPVRGQNNVQGSCDMGALPNVYPGYQSVEDAKLRKKFEKAWGTSLPDKTGYRLTEVPHLILKEHKIKAYYIFGEDPVQSDPNAAELREALDQLELVIVQDIFMNKTALHADVILPATSWGEHDGVYSSADRGFQRIRKAIEPPGGVKPDWQIISEVSTAMGYPMAYKNSEEIWDEMRKLCPSFAGASYRKMETQGDVQWPCPSEDHPGTPYLYKGNRFTTPNGKGQLFACEWRAPLEQPDVEYPLTLSTVREVGHYSVRTMTGNCRALSQLSDEPGNIQISLEDAAEYGIENGHLVRVISRRGKIMARAQVSGRTKQGATYMTYHFWIGACNELTADYLDPVSKTPEYKYCAVRVEAIADQAKAEALIRKQYAELRKQMMVGAMQE
ncbi:formate dehydrogenase subunit alpha [Paenibacillus sp. P3E]|uniref:formate dehydrogenase subunit alpha n=1 Tax=unclassified Paenibacillus TaxID=185978 RepID=UPI00093F3282|nr:MULTISPECIES: formate dehydrogenase subunit alpha [unclassified Paenibacillus]OKP70108.1 formate dehydrogenase subunit alpha [Paenibacillus sp. P3E]OKP88928.1 formate dehydrogenase subunit alpha [Paenibacillus sp. P32E]